MIDKVGPASHSGLLAPLYLSFPFSIDWLPDGRLLIVSSSDRPLLRQEPDGTLVDHADLKRGFNEIVVDNRCRKDHKFASSLSLIRRFVPPFFDAYLRPKLKLTHKPVRKIRPSKVPKFVNPTIKRLLEHLDDANIRACITNESPESDRLSR